MLVNTDGAIKKDNPEKLATYCTQDEENKTQHNMCWKPIYTNVFAYKWKFLDGNIEILSFVGKFRS